MATTTNFGWETPDDSDLVKDGAAAMRTLGNSIDASMADLRGGTSGQILSKNSNTDMDFTWIANDQGDITAVTAGTGISGGGTSGAVTITNSMATEITAKGDLIVGTGNATFDNLPVGTNGYVLTADSTVSPTGLKWAALAAASFVGCKLTKSANQVVGHNTDTKISWDQEDFDTDGFHDNTTNNTRVTIPTGKGGKYLFVAAMAWASNATGKRESWLYKNGNAINTYFIQTAVNGQGTHFIVTNLIEAAAGDYIELGVNQNSGGNLNFETIAYFACQYLGA